MLNKALMSSETCEWETPDSVFEPLDSIYRFQVDVCATKENAKAKKFFTKEQNGLEQEWNGTCWMNPPYGREIGKWVQKAFESAEEGKATVVCLLPARTDTRWWHEWCMKGDVRFLRGRIKFWGAKYGAPFPSAIVVFDREKLTKVINREV